MFAYYPIPGGRPMSWCSDGHIVAPGTESFVRDGSRYCLEHIPEPEPPPEPPYEFSPRRLRHIEFQRWRYQQGAFADDDHPEPLSDDDKDRLARHVLP